MAKRSRTNALGPRAAVCFMQSTGQTLEMVRKLSYTKSLHYRPLKRSCLLEWDAAGSQGVPPSALGLSAVLPILNARSPLFIISSSPVPVIQAGPVLVDARTELVLPPWTCRLSSMASPFAASSV